MNPFHRFGLEHVGTLVLVAADALVFVIFWALMIPFRGQARSTRQL